MIFSISVRIPTKETIAAEENAFALAAEVYVQRHKYIIHHIIYTHTYTVYDYIIHVSHTYTETVHDNTSYYAYNTSHSIYKYTQIYKCMISIMITNTPMEEISSKQWRIPV